MNIIKNILGNKRFGGKNDWDFDGVPNRRDCQPRNTMRQDDDEEEVIFRGPRRKARENEYWTRFKTPEGRTIIALKKREMSVEDVMNVLGSSWLTEDEKMIKLGQEGVSDSRIRIARMRLRDSRRRFR